jgi:hypothetical protein
MEHSEKKAVRKMVEELRDETYKLIGMEGNTYWNLLAIADELAKITFDAELTRITYDKVVKQFHTEGVIITKPWTSLAIAELNEFKDCMLLGNKHFHKKLRYGSDQFEEPVNPEELYIKCIISEFIDCELLEKLIKPGMFKDPSMGFGT